VVGGTCHGDTTNLLNGEIIGTGIQPRSSKAGPRPIDIQIPQTGKVLDGDTLPSGPTPTRRHPMRASRTGSTSYPTPGSANTKADLDNFKLWGYSFKELCNY